MNLGQVKADQARADAYDAVVEALYKAAQQRTDEQYRTLVQALCAHADEFYRKKIPASLGVTLLRAVRTPEENACPRTQVFDALFQALYVLRVQSLSLEHFVHGVIPTAISILHLVEEGVSYEEFKQKYIEVEKSMHAEVV